MEFNTAGEESGEVEFVIPFMEQQIHGNEQHKESPVYEYIMYIYAYVHIISYIHTVCTYIQTTLHLT